MKTNKNDLLKKLAALVDQADDSERDYKADASRAWAVLLEGRSPLTGSAYLQAAKDLANHVSAADHIEALAGLLALDQGQLNEAVQRYRNSVSRRSAPATVNLRLAMLKSFFKAARFLGVVSTTIEVRRVKGEKSRDTSGASAEQIVVAIQRALKGSPSDVRNAAIVALLFYCGLRISEALGADLKHLDLEAGTLSIKGKGRSQRETVTIPAPCKEVLTRWLKRRGDEPGPLVCTIRHWGDHAKGHRLTQRDVYRRIRDHMKLKRCHGMRHAAITEVLNLTGGNLRQAQAFARHASVTTTSMYDDKRTDAGQQASATLAKAFDHRSGS